MKHAVSSRLIVVFEVFLSFFFLVTTSFNSSLNWKESKEIDNPKEENTPLK